MVFENSYVKCLNYKYLTTRVVFSSLDQLVKQISETKTGDFCFKPYLLMHNEKSILNCEIQC